MFRLNQVTKNWMKKCERENLKLFLGYDIIRSGNDSNCWNINWNVLFFELLSLGFRLGNKQDVEAIKLKIPTEFQVVFLEGYNRGSIKNEEL